MVAQRTCLSSLKEKLRVNTGDASATLVSGTDSVCGGPIPPGTAIFLKENFEKLIIYYLTFFRISDIINMLKRKNKNFPSKYQN